MQPLESRLLIPPLVKHSTDFFASYPAILVVELKTLSILGKCSTMGPHPQIGIHYASPTSAKSGLELLVGKSPLLSPSGDCVGQVGTQDCWFNSPPDKEAPLPSTL